MYSLNVIKSPEDLVAVTVDRSQHGHLPKVFVVDVAVLLRDGCGFSLELIPAQEYLKHRCAEAPSSQPTGPRILHHILIVELRRGVRVAQDDCRASLLTGVLIAQQGVTDMRARALLTRFLLVKTSFLTPSSI